ncbi:lysophosphatidic acid receptor 5-like [Bombina bombina]|uniref:lysophosphatidic acid receptor 5-like n=1 Tax=Bombina bombina TaxID=8345 RepID=UPI00235B0D55|nr:lysophosphatidic acid receptor 5-like [Bombina bombina]
MINISELDVCDTYSPPSTKTLLLVGYSLLLPLGVVLNGVSLFIFLYGLRPLSVVGIFLCNLAISDLLFSLSLPFRIYYYSQHHWPFGPFLCRLSGSIFQINMYGSCVFLLCINLDRYLAIVYPLRFRHLRRPKVAYLVCFSVWLLIVMGSVPAALVHSSSNCWNGDYEVPRCFEGLTSWQGRVFPLLLVAEVLGFLLPLVVVLYASCSVFWELCCAQEGGQERHRRTINLLCLNLCIFLFCFVPYNTTLMAYGLLRAELVSDPWEALPVVKKMLSFTMLLASTNCALDPMVYYFSTEGFRKTLHKLSRKARNTEIKQGLNNVTMNKGKQQISSVVKGGNTQEGHRNGSHQVKEETRRTLLSYEVNKANPARNNDRKSMMLQRTIEESSI